MNLELLRFFWISYKILVLSSNGDFFLIISRNGEFQKIKLSMEYFSFRKKNSIENDAMHISETQVKIHIREYIQSMAISIRKVSAFL